jgi:hypothetical protein
MPPASLWRRDEEEVSQEVQKERNYKFVMTL